MATLLESFDTKEGLGGQIGFSKSKHPTQPKSHYFEYKIRAKNTM